MSMFLQRSKPSTLDNSTVESVHQRLVDFLDAQRRPNGSTQREFSTKRLIDVSGDVPSISLAGMIVGLVETGVLEQFVRVETNGGEGLEDFDSLAHVPNEVYDWRDSHELIRVTPANLHIYYRLIGID